MAAPTRTDDLQWYSVRYVFKHGDAMFEERITVWRAKDEDHAIQLAEEEAAHYNEEITDSPNPTKYVGLAQCFELYAHARTRARTRARAHARAKRHQRPHGTEAQFSVRRTPSLSRK